METLFSVEEKMVALEVFRAWVAPRMSSYVEPTREGTSRGEPIGLSRKKYYAANLMALYFRGAFTLAELAREADVSHDQLRNWRVERQFKKVSKESFFAFRHYIKDQADKCIEDWNNQPCEKYLVWLKLFATEYTMFKAKLLNKLQQRFLKDDKNIPSLIDMLKYLCALEYNFKSLDNPSLINIALTTLLINWLILYIQANTPMDDTQKQLITLLLVKLNTD